jgi:hypothetical protein
MKKPSTQKRESLKLNADDWSRLERLAADTDSFYMGRPSWRRLIARIASGEVKVRVPKRKHAPRSAVGWDSVPLSDFDPNDMDPNGDKSLHVYESLPEAAERYAQENIDLMAKGDAEIEIPKLPEEDEIMACVFPDLQRQYRLNTMKMIIAGKVYGIF